jgi:hypothetical protein
MSDVERPPLVAVQQNGASRPAGVSPIFQPEPQQRGGMPLAAWGVAALIVLAAIGGLVLAGRKKAAPLPITLQPPDAYAASLPLSQFAMSESENLSGGKVTYLDGHVQNTGSRTVTGVTVQVVFQNDEAMPPLVDTLPLTLIRMRQPYIDTEPVSAAPLKPGDEMEFRLIFEAVPENWNTQMPEVRVIHTDLK